MINFHKATFLAGFSKYEQIFNSNYIEFAFWGRSNVGKSSLINALTNNKKLVRVSKNPGCTKQINLFNIDNKIVFADLPGYGYSKVSKTDVISWQELIINYFKMRKQLFMIFLLIDSRRSLLEIDEKMIEWILYYNVKFFIILTKVDKITNLSDIIDDVNQKIDLITNKTINTNNFFNGIIAVSSINNININKFQQIIMNYSKK
ncbi:ribosome biogenesis GTP-binding protein YihA/YsxC [Lyticum sinuosum]|uniref:Probable GTP-binding protein EngB n=1 Tax=Lyticum sinuosum TaxID=1332059 RepID=A0AAE4VM69_9RICK|nr:ribosome biogenesis GTP-binding protein YihA/YsxC [Lyticum sinuosum]MDZ5761199.1 EngB/YsxC GTP-binding protein [Lyticum sinuosum]